MCRVVYLCNAILVTEILCYQYSTINNFARKGHFSTKFGDQLSNLLWIKCTKFYSDSFRFDISIVQCLRVYFFTGHSVRLYGQCHKFHTQIVLVYL